MSYGSDVLANRTVSAYPLSIGTSLFLESLSDGPDPTYDPLRVVPKKTDITKYDELWINLYTLFRNILGAIDKDGFNKVTPLAIKEVLEFEVELIKNLISSISYGKTKAIFYASDYAGLERKYPHSRLRNDTTEKQKIYTALLVNSVNLFFKDQTKSDHLQHFKLELNPKESKNALIVTSYAIDLLCYKNFKNLDLLESHTGNCLNVALWHSKFFDGKNLVRIPFNNYFLQIFGDKSTFHPWPKNIRDEIITIAEKYKWVYNTSKDRIIMGIENIKDGYTIATIKEMM